MEAMLNLIVECQGIARRLQAMRDQERKLQVDIGAAEQSLRLLLLQLEHERERELGLRK